jgi:hypothetical protein
LISGVPTRLPVTLSPGSSFVIVVSCLAMPPERVV